MKKTIKTLVLITATIGVATVVKRVNERLTILEKKTDTSYQKLSTRPGMSEFERIDRSLQTQIAELKTTQSELNCKLNLKVDKNNLIRWINLTPERIRIDSSKIGASTESLDARSVRVTNIKTDDI